MPGETPAMKGHWYKVDLTTRELWKARCIEHARLQLAAFFSRITAGTSTGDGDSLPL